MISTSLVVDAEAFTRLLWNANLFTPKTGVVEATVFFSIRVGAHWDLTMVACDDFIVVQDSIPFRVTEQDNAVIIEPMQFTLPRAFVIDFEKEVRKVKGYVEFSVIDGHFTARLEQTEDADDLIMSEKYDTPAQVWGELLEILEAEYSPASEACYINPERLKQIPRMKIEGDHPVGWYLAKGDGQVVVPFIYGPTVKGIITSMNEQKLIERGVHTWGTVADPEVQYSVGDKVTVGGIEFTKIAEPEVPFDHGDPSDPPPWDERGPTNIDTNDGKDLQGVRAKHWSPIGTRVEYTDPVDPDVTPDHVNAEEYEEYGY